MALSKPSVSLGSLPEEIILHIFEFCDVQSLGRLASTCHKFKKLIDEEPCCWKNKAFYKMGSNMFKEPMRKKSKPFLEMKRRCQVSKNWRNALYQSSTIARYYRCLPWICLDQNYFFCSKERMLVQYLRKDDTGNVRFDREVRILPHMDDVSRFSINDTEVVTASRDGTVGRWRKGDLRRIHRRACHDEEIYSVEVKDEFIVTGSRDKTVKIWKATEDDTLFREQISMGVRVLSVAIMPSKREVIVGLSGTRSIHPLQVFDLQTARFITNLGGEFINGAGILNIYPEDEHKFLCCGYDGTVKLWDLRVANRHAASWMDPYDNAINCVKSDHHVTIITGASRNAVFHMWDKRSPLLKYIQHIQEFNSPVYSIDFDASHLYVALDRAVVQFSYL